MSHCGTVRTPARSHTGTAIRAAWHHGAAVSRCTRRDGTSGPTNSEVAQSVDAIDISGDVAIVAITLLTVNILLGMLMSIKYNPVRSWPHRRVNTLKLHNWTGYL